MRISIFQLLTVAAVLFLSPITSLVMRPESYLAKFDRSHLPSAIRVQKRGTKWGYHCTQIGKSKRKYIKVDKINDALTKACDRVQERLGEWPYPAEFSLTSFSEPGPYLEWPIDYHGPLSSDEISPYRLVIDKQCKLLEVLTHFKDSHYEQCEQRLA